MQPLARLLALTVHRQHAVLVDGQRRALSRIYTRGGDQGESSLFTGERRQKGDLVFDALGSSDELSAFVGVAKGACASVSPDLHTALGFVQETLLHLGSHLATPSSPGDGDDAALAKRLAMTQFDQGLVDWVEQNIDQMTQKLPPLRNFILSEGGASAHLHVARSVCRRFERDVVRLSKSGHSLDPAVLKFVNRLSDFFFTAARYVAQLENQPDHVFRSLDKTYPRCQY